MIGLYAGLEKYSCDACGEIGERATHVLKHKDGSRMDLCRRCAESLKLTTKFQEGLKNGEVQLIER